ncbi:MAG TPA: DedA family protein [Ktedonobacterales bacterium]|jgi:membrane protein DedA with SNARE-associated domain|nr:DedA family protein [Ktedonobacterales bacterium]
MTQLVATLGHIPPIAVYLFVFTWLALESCGLPLPNELVLLLVGSLTASIHPGLSPIPLVVVATLGSLLGASAAYAIGLRGGRAAVLRLGRRIRLDEKRLDSVEAWFARTGSFAIFISRITPFVRTVASFPAGMLRLPRRSFVVATVAGSLIWCTLMVTLGHILGANYDHALKLIEEYTVPAILVLAAVVAGYFWLHGKLSHVGAAPVTEAETEFIHERERR